MSLTKNQAYLKGLMSQVKKGVDKYTQSVVIETLSWLATMTVQDTGNAAAQWYISVNGEKRNAIDMRFDESTSYIGPTRGKKRTLEDIGSSAESTVEDLSGDAKLAPDFAVTQGKRKLTEIVMKTDFAYPSLALINPIPPSGDDYQNYELHALGRTINVSEAMAFGPGRGIQTAMRYKVVQNVTS